MNDLEHLLVAAARTPRDPSLGHRFLDLLLNSSVGVAGRLHEGNEFTPLLVGTTERHHAVAFTHPARFARFAEVMSLDRDVQTQPLTGRDAFERLVASTIPLLVNPQNTYTREVGVPEMSAVLTGMRPGDAYAPTAGQPRVADRRGPHGTPVAGTPAQPPMPAMPPRPAGPMVGPPAYVVPGLYERLAGYFDWLGGIDEAVLLWVRQPTGHEGYLLKIRSQLHPQHVTSQIGTAIGDLQGRRLDVVVHGWHEPPWTEGVPSFYLLRR